MRSTARSICGMAARTAAATVASSSLMSSRTCRVDDRGSRVGLAVELRDDIHERRDAEVAQQMRCDRRCGAASVGVMRRRAQSLEPEPDTGSLVADEIAPPAGPLLLALVVAAER